MRKRVMRVLNLYAGIGGNRKLWQDVEVTAVENNSEIAEIYKQHFPDDIVIVGDAHQYLLDHYSEFDFIWSSPPCPSHSKMARVNHSRYGHRRYPDMSLYQEIIFLEEFYQGLYVVENVEPYYQVLRPAQSLGRHLFWANFKITKIRNDHPNLMSLTLNELKSHLGIALNKNIYLNGNHDHRQVFRNCVHPEIGLHILNCARGVITSTKETLPLFN